MRCRLWADAVEKGFCGGLQGNIDSKNPLVRIRLFHSNSTARQANECRHRKCSGWRCEGLSLLYDIGDENPALGVAGLTTSMRRFGRDLERVAVFERAGRLTLYGKLEAAFQDKGGFDSRMRVPPDGHSGLYRRFHKQRLVARRRTVRLRQDLSRDAARRCGRGSLGRGFGGNKRRNSADRAGRKTRESSSCQHDVVLPCRRRVWITSARAFLMKIVSLSRSGWQGKRLRCVITDGLMAKNPHGDRLTSPSPVLAPSRPAQPSLSS